MGNRRPHLRTIEHRGVLVDHCGLPGETRADDVFPAHPNGLQVARDGILRLFSGDSDASPYGDTRNPLYVWDVDPDREFAVSHRRVVFDALAAGLGRGGDLMVGMCKLLAPHGNRQLLLHRVAPRVYDPDLADADKQRCGIYYAWLHYEGRVRPRWRFAPASPAPPGELCLEG